MAEMTQNPIPEPIPEEIAKEPGNYVKGYRGVGTAVSTVHSNKVSPKLNNGTQSGVIKTVNSGFPQLSNSGFDADKALNIVDALENCLAKEVVRVEHTQVAYLSRS